MGREGTIEDTTESVWTEEGGENCQLPTTRNRGLLHVPRTTAFYVGSPVFSRWRPGGPSDGTHDQMTQRRKLPAGIAFRRPQRQRSYKERMETELTMLRGASRSRLTLSVPSTTVNVGSRDTVTFISNSRSIRATSSAAHRRSFSVASIASRADWMPAGERVKLSWIADKRGEVAGLRLERAVGIQGSPPFTQPTPNSTSRRFGNLEKSKDRLKVWPSTSVVSVPIVSYNQ